DILASKEIRTTTKLRIFNSNVKSVLLCGSDTWRKTEVIQHKIQRFTNNCLRRIFNIRWIEKRRDEELWQRAGQKPVYEQIMRRKRSSIEQALRKPPSSLTRRALIWNPEGKRKRTRPRSS
ncbi:hypothetical protein FSP39_022162, partial [Pinctada imbricata]